MSEFNDKCLRTSILIRYICKLQLGWHPVAVVQYTFAHKQYIEQHNRQNNTVN